MAEYLDIDPTIVRILWILAALFSGGLMILAYIILAFVIPEAPFTGATNQGWTAPAGTAPGQGWSAAAGPAGYQAGSQPGAAAPTWSPDWAAQAAAERQARERSRGRGPGAAVIVGTILVVFGVIALFDSMMPAWFGAVVFGPALVIAIGAALLVASVRRRDEPVAGRRHRVRHGVVRGTRTGHRPGHVRSTRRGRDRLHRHRLRRRRHRLGRPRPPGRSRRPPAGHRARVIGVPLLLLGLLLVLGAFGPRDPGPERGVVARFLRSPLHPATWYATGAIVAGFWVGLFAFTFLIGLRLGGLLDAVHRPRGRVHRRRDRGRPDRRPHRAGAGDDRRSAPARRPPVPARTARGIRDLAAALFLDVNRWRDLGYVFVAFPLLALEFVAVTVLWTAVLRPPLDPGLDAAHRRSRSAGSTCGSSSTGVPWLASLEPGRAVGRSRLASLLSRASSCSPWPRSRPRGSWPSTAR